METGNNAVQLKAPCVKMVEWFDQHWYKIDLLREDGKPETRWVPSVTTKLNIVDKPFLPKWRGDVGNREADMRLFEAQERGSRIHHAWHVFCTGGTILYNPWQRPNYSEEEIKALTAETEGNIVVVKYQDEMLALWKLQQLVEIVKPEMIFSEKVLYSLTHNDAGTADNAWAIKEGKYPINGKVPLYIPGGKYLLDLKNGSVVGDQANNQTAAYAHCDEEMGSEPYAGTMIVHTSANTKLGIPGLGITLRTRQEVEKDYEEYRLAAKLWEMKNENAAPRVFEFPSLIKLTKENTNEPRPEDVRSEQQEVH